jgi:hypothetical protein
VYFTMVEPAPAAGSWADGGNAQPTVGTGVLFVPVGGIAECPDSPLEFVDQLIVRGVRATVGVVQEQLRERFAGGEGPIGGFWVN